MSGTARKTEPARALAVDLPPLEHGDHLSGDEFTRRWEAMPDLKRAELLEGMVFLASEYDGRILDPSIPPLENGDHLTWEEFERRWDNMPDLKKAERYNGMVFMPPPVSATRHGMPHSDLIFWLGLYRAATPGVLLSDNGTVHLLPDIQVQPDATLFLPAECGGIARLDEKGYVVGGPEFVAEVAGSSVSFDLHWKLDVYRSNGVREYLVWRVDDQAIDWFTLQDGRYNRLPPSENGWFKSGMFPGLRLDAAALLRGDLAAVMHLQQQGLASADHAAFVARLAAVRSSKP